MGWWSKLFGDRLSAAVDKGDINQVERLLNDGADPNVGQLGLTVLITASNSGHAEIVRMLLDKGADPNGKDWEGWTALMAASAGMGISGKNKEERCMEIVNMLIEKGADVHAKTKKAETALTHAARAGHNKVKELLLQHGAKE